MEIIRQADAFGLPSEDRAPTPPPERVADLLTPPPMFSGPAKVVEE